MLVEQKESALDHFAQLVDQLPVALYVCEAPSGVIRLYNARAAELWGRTPRAGDTSERFCGSLRLFRLDGTPLLHADTPMAEALAGAGHREDDVVVERPDGSRITVRVSITHIRDAEGRVIGAINAFHDVTERRRAEDAAAHLAAVVENANDAIVSKTLDGVITSWNRGAERIFGYPEAEAVGQRIDLIIPPERMAEEREILARLRRGERVEHLETERRTRDGRLIPISLTVSPVKDRQGRIIGASKVARDISERRQFERERDELLERERGARAAAEAANLAKDEFLAMLAHELRNPVGTIVNALAILERGGEATRQHAQARRIMRRQTEHLAQLLDDLLDVARITSGRIELELDELDLGAVIAEAVECERSRMEAKGQRVQVEAAAEPVHVQGDALRLHQIFGNLLNNASKYTPSGGAITVSLGVDGPDAVARIRDTGEGIPAGMLDSIFELFTQGNPTLARTQGGLGVGLAVVRKLVGLHGGAVTARSDGYGRGAEFTVRLPLSCAGTAPAPPAVDALDGARDRVLVIEDNPDGREMMVAALRLAGHDVRAAATGAEGISLALSHDPSVVLLDLGLPDIDGYDVGRTLRERLGDRVRLLAVSGYGLPQDRLRTREAGFDDYVVKPVDPERLCELVRPAT